MPKVIGRGSPMAATRAADEAPGRGRRRLAGRSLAGRTARELDEQAVAFGSRPPCTTGEHRAERAVKLTRAVCLSHAPLDHVDEPVVEVEHRVHVGRAGPFGQDRLGVRDLLLLLLAFAVDALDLLERVASEPVAVVYICR